MAELTKKLNYRRAGVNYTVDIYNSTADVGSNYLSLRIDGQMAYAKLGATTDEDACHLLIRKANTTYAVLYQALQELPSGFIAVFDSVCPTGWTRETSFDGYFLRGAAAYNATPQGSAAHTHTFSPGTVNTSISTLIGDKIDTNNEFSFAAPSHDHLYTVPSTTSSSQSPLPPYINVVFCRKD